MEYLEKYLIEREARKNINKKQLTKGSKFTDEKIIFFVDTYAHLQKAKQLIGYFHEKKIFFITNKKQIYKNLHGQSRIFFKSRIDLFRISRKMKKTNHSYVVARVMKLTSKFYTTYQDHPAFIPFDEGLFSIRSDSIYNAENFMLKNYGYRLSISNLIFNFPKNASYFYKNTKIISLGLIKKVSKIPKYLKIELLRSLIKVNQKKVRA